MMKRVRRIRNQLWICSVSDDDFLPERGVPVKRSLRETAILIGNSIDDVFLFAVDYRIRLDVEPDAEAGGCHREAGRDVEDG